MSPFGCLLSISSLKCPKLGPNNPLLVPLLPTHVHPFWKMTTLALRLLSFDSSLSLKPHMQPGQEILSLHLNWYQNLDHFSLLLCSRSEPLDSLSPLSDKSYFSSKILLKCHLLWGTSFGTLSILLVYGSSFSQFLAPKKHILHLSHLGIFVVSLNCSGCWIINGQHETQYLRMTTLLSKSIWIFISKDAITKNVATIFDCWLTSGRTCIFSSFLVCF